MKLNKWLAGVIVAIITGAVSAFVTGGLIPTATNKELLFILIASIGKDFMLYMKQHPVDEVKFGDTEIIEKPASKSGYTVIKWICILAFTSVIIAFVCLMVGCAGFGTTQKDISYDPKTGNKIRAITTHVATHTFFDSRSALANSKASQTDKTQSANLGSLSQESSGTNAATLIEGIVGAAVKAAVKP